MCGTTASVNTADIVGKRLMDRNSENWGDLCLVSDLLANVDMTNMKCVCPGLGDFAFLGWKPNADLDQEAHNVRREAP